MKTANTQTDDVENEPSVALNFVRNVSKPPAKKEANSKQAVKTKAVKTKAAKSDSKSANSTPDKKPKKSPIAKEQKARAIYEPFSTRVRRDLKRQLKRISLDREYEGHASFTTQALVEEALIDWLNKHLKG